MNAETKTTTVKKPVQITASKVARECPRCRAEALGMPIDDEAEGDRLEAAGAIRNDRHTCPR